MNKLPYHIINEIYSYSGYFEKFKKHFYNNVLNEMQEKIYNSAKNSGRLIDYPHFMIREINGIINVLQPPKQFTTWDELEASLILRKISGKTILKTLNYDINCNNFIYELEKLSPNVFELFEKKVEEQFWTAVNSYYSLIYMARGWDDSDYANYDIHNYDYGPIYKRLQSIR